MTKEIMTPTTVSDNPCTAGLIKAAKRGDTRSSAACLYIFGRDLQDQKVLDPALAQYIGNCLVDVARMALTMRGKKTEKRATEVAKVLGLIAPRHGRPATQFKPIRKLLDVASLVIHFRQQGCPLTRNEDGAFYKVAKVLQSKPGTVEAAYRESKKRKGLLDLQLHEIMRIRANLLIERSRKRN